MTTHKWLHEVFQVLHFNSGSGSSGGSPLWLNAPGVFIFVGPRPDHPEWSPKSALFVGTADSLLTELPDQRNSLATPEYPLNEVHVRVEHNRDTRESFARSLIEEYKPPLNS